MEAIVNSYKSRIFPKSKQEKISSRGLYQRYIITFLALQIPSMTRRALARPLAIKFNLSLRSAYEHVSIELEKSLVPDGIVERAESVPTDRGPRIYQEEGIQCYRLTNLGMLVASCLDEIGLDDRKRLLRNLLISNGYDDLVPDHNLRRELLSYLEEYPQFTLELVKDGIRKFLDGKLNHPLDSIPKKSSS